MKSFISHYALFFAFLLSLSFAFSSYQTHFLVPTLAEDSAPAVIIDAGHGGADGGATGKSGVKEKDLNLAVAQSLASRLKEAGIRVLLTREEDSLVLYEGDDVKGERKQNDLKNRAAIAARYPDAIFVSIHMNAFPVDKYRGFQVHYAKESAASRQLATLMTEKVKSELDPIYPRAPKATGEEIYLLSHISGTAVLVECGFLSNPAEEALLCEKDYQNKLSFCLFCAIMEM